MNAFLPMGVLAAALVFCGLTDQIKKMAGGGGSSPATNSSTKKPGSDSSSSDSDAPKPELTSAQQAIVDGGTDAAWADQGITFRVPAGWPKMDVKKEMFMYGSPEKGFLIANISVLPSSVPMDMSLKGYYDSSLEQLKNGKYVNARYLEIDGIKGVEFIEAPPEDKGDPRRHQWIGFRSYQGQNQMVNIMTSADGGKWDPSKEDAFKAIIYSMKIGK